MTVYLPATLDTKGEEAQFVRDRLNQLGIPTKLIDAGCLGVPSVPADITREEVFQRAGTSHAEMLAQGDRGEAVMRAAAGVERIVQDAYARGELAGVLGLGGSAGTIIASQAMRSLPIGVPKLIVSTLASGNTRPYVRDKDIVLLNSVVDIAGINRISRRILNEAAAAMAGMIRFRADETSTDKPLIAATMFGVTTPCMQHARKILEAAGYEVLVFHATGNGGEAMESLIRDGLIAGVLDITTTELADELVGGILSAGPTRLTAAGERGIPQVVSVGALDMVNFGPMESIPERFRHRRFHRHNASVTLMRTTPDENEALGAEIAKKLAASKGPTSIFLPRRGVSAIDRAGESFDDPIARERLFDSIRRHGDRLEIRELDYHINDPEFATAAAERLMRLLEMKRQGVDRGVV